MKSRVCVVFLLLVVQSQHNSLPIRRFPGASAGCFCERRVWALDACQHDGTGWPRADGDANEQCEVDFENVPVGRYRILVSGEHVANADAGTVGLDSDRNAEFEVKVRGYDEPERADGVPMNSLVSAADLGIPARARKELDKANELLARQELEQAVQRLNKAIEIYPAYAVAYNNLASDLCAPGRPRAGESRHCKRRSA